MVFAEKMQTDLSHATVPLPLKSNWIDQPYHIRALNFRNVEFVMLCHNAGLCITNCIIQKTARIIGLCYFIRILYKMDGRGRAPPQTA